MENNLEDLNLKVTNPQKFWQLEIDRANKFYEDWMKQAQNVNDIYADRDKTQSKFNILWSNVDTLRSAIFAKAGNPDVRRRFGGIQDPQKNAISNAVATVLERSLDYCADTYDSKTQIQNSVLDSLVVGRGVVRVKYEPIMATRVTENQVLTEDGMMLEGKTEEFIADQKLFEEYINWECFLTEPATKWDDIRWVAFKQSYTAEELTLIFGDEVASKIPMDEELISSDKVKNNGVPVDFKRAIIWEIWDKPSRSRIYFSANAKEVLRVDEDPYKLEQFFPMARPLYGAVNTTDTIVPKPDYCIYQDQATELNLINTRISKLIEALKRRGVFDAGFKEAENLATARDNTFIAIDNFQMLNGQGLGSIFATEDLTPISNVLSGLYTQRAQIIQSIYEITGISDVIRGSSNPNETATAQRIKGQFGSMRLRARQDDVQRFIKDTLRLKAEIIAEHFEAETLAGITGIDVNVINQLLPILRSDKLRGYTVDIETDSTIFDDDAQNKAQTVEMIGALTGFMKEFMPIIQGNPAIAPMAMGIMRLGLGAFKKGREIEGQMEQAFAQLSQPKPNQEALLKQQELEAQKVKDRADIAIKEQGNNIRQAEVMLEAKKVQNQQMNNIANLALEEKQANQDNMGMY